MITILPVKDRLLAARLQKENDISEKFTLLAMREQDEILGVVAVALEEKTLTIEKFCLSGYDFSQSPNPQQTFILDSLLRAAASYGENFGATEICTTFKDFYDFLSNRGFCETNNTAIALINHFVKNKIPKG